MVRSLTLGTNAVMSLLGALRRDKQAFTDWAHPEKTPKGRKYTSQMEQLDSKCASIFVRDDAILYGLFQAFDDPRIESITITPNYRRSDGEEA